MATQTQAQSNQQAVFARLKAILQEYEPHLVVKADEESNYYLDAPPSAKHPKGVFFGAVQVRKHYVSYHLMPVYGFPDLLDGMSDGLKKRMQGKSCYNFTKLDEEVLGDLSELTRRGFERYRQEQWL